MHLPRAPLAALLLSVLLVGAACADPLAQVGDPDAPATDTETSCNWFQWGAERTAVADWFAHNPDAAALHRWDGDSGQFEVTRRSEPAKADFRSLHADGLFWVEYDEPAAGFSYSDAQHLIALRRGVNLIPWTGSDDPDGALAAAMQWLAPDLIDIQHWDADANLCRRTHDPLLAFPSPTVLSEHIGPRDLVALQLRHDTTWTQSWLHHLTLFTVGNLRPESYAGLVAEIPAVSGFFSTRYSVEADDYGVSLLDSVASYRLAFEPHSEFPAWPESACGLAVSGAVILLEGCGDPIPFDHEYVHVLQNHILADALVNQQGGDAAVPIWLIEGMAEYFSARYRDAAWYETYRAFRSDAVRDVVNSDERTPLSQLVTLREWRAADGRYAYPLAFLASELLAAHAGEEAFFNFYRDARIAQIDDRWEQAFHDVFGFTPDDFYARFEAHSQAFDEPRPHLIRGTLSSPDGGDVAGMAIHAYPWPNGESIHAHAAADGAFAIAVPAGSWRIALHSESNCTGYGHYADGGASATWYDAARIESGRGQDQRIVIELPEPSNQLRGWSTCDEAEGVGWLRGIITDSRGAPLPNVAVTACSDTPLCGRAVTRSDGSYRIDAPPGDYVIFMGPSEDHCLLWGWRTNRGVVARDRDEAAQIELGSRPRGNLDIQIAQPVDQLTAINLCP